MANDNESHEDRLGAHERLVDRIMEALEAEVAPYDLKTAETICEQLAERIFESFRSDLVEERASGKLCIEKVIMPVYEFTASPLERRYLLAKTLRRILEVLLVRIERPYRDSLFQA